MADYYIERSFSIAFNSSDAPESLIAAIRRRTDSIHKMLHIEGPFVLRMPASWLPHLNEKYSGMSYTFLERILKEKVSGVQLHDFLSGEPEFSLVWKLRVLWKQPTSRRLT